ncbi:MAG: XamI family restriction endonuclease [Bacteroidaceae bacterium]|nr:XamI family restriction endonuclease [Bacteroidaceae bacterium]
MLKQAINRRRTGNWKADVIQSVRFYNDWFMNFAPHTYINARQNAIQRVDAALVATHCFHQITADVLASSPETITILRKATTPPLATDRLIGLSYAVPSLVESMEKGKLPAKMDSRTLRSELDKIIAVIDKLLDREIFPWLADGRVPSEDARLLAASIVADRVCGSLADPIIRNEQERRQLESIGKFLLQRGYTYLESKAVADFRQMPAGSFAYHLNVPVKLTQTRGIKMPIDVVVMRHSAAAGELPLLIECKSAGDFTNTNKRRKEEATKMEQLTKNYGRGIEFMLFLCGYFDSGYLGYEAAEGIDWVWEHRIEDLAKAGI